jgi:hypothetical protein
MNYTWIPFHALILTKYTYNILTYHYMDHQQSWRNFVEDVISRGQAVSSVSAAVSHWQKRR